MRHKRRIASLLIAGTTALTLGAGIADAAPAPKTTVPPPACGLAQNFGLSHLGGPGCNPLRPYKHLGPYASEDHCDRDKPRQMGRFKGSRMAHCNQGTSGFYYMTIMADFGR